MTFDVSTNAGKHVMLTLHVHITGENIVFEHTYTLYI